MNCHNETAAVSTPLVRLMTWLALALLLGAPAHAIDSGDIVVASVKGQVSVTMNGAARGVRAGSVLELPATVRTGPDGAIELKQGATSVSVGPDTQLDFPALEKRGAPVDRIVQPRGNAFYDIGKREGRKLRVETPYLVGVIKGTQFNVSAQDDSTTISLFEGRLEVCANDGEPVDLRAGEIASRGRGDASISVIKMNEKAPATAPVSQQRNGGDGRADGNDGNSRNTSPMPPRHERHDVARDDSQIPDYTMAPRIVTVDDRSVASIGVDLGSRDLGEGASVNPASSAAADVAVHVDAGIGAQVDVAVDPPGAGAVGVDTDARASVDVGANTSVDVGGDGVSVDVASGADLAAGGVTTTIDTGAGVDLGTGGVSVDVDAGVAAGVGDVAAVDAGVNAGVNVGAGTIDVGLNAGGIDVGPGIDLGLDDGNNGHGNDSDVNDPSNPGNSPPPATPGNIIEDVGGLLDGLLRRPGRR